MKAEWKGGPLDGCVEEGDKFRILWYGPDPSAPTTKVVVYKLMTRRALGKVVPGSVIYQYDMRLTQLANEHITDKPPETN